MNENSYLTNIPQSTSQYGLCKVLAVRHEIIHVKHIFTEIFVRKSINIDLYLQQIGYSVFDYMEHMTNRLRKIHHFSREYVNDINNIVKSERDKFFPAIALTEGLNSIIVLDFDGVVTKKSFEKLYKLCIQRCKVVICSANPTITNDFFEKRELPIPHNIYACKGKLKKIKKIIEISKYHDLTFYIDNEREYLEYAWLFGIKTFMYESNKIKYFTLKTK